MNETVWMMLGAFIAMGLAVALWAWVTAGERSSGTARRHPTPPQPAVWRSARPPAPSSAPAYRRRPGAYTGGTSSKEPRS